VLWSISGFFSKTKLYSCPIATRHESNNTATTLPTNASVCHPDDTSRLGNASHHTPTRFPLLHATGKRAYNQQQKFSWLRKFLLQTFSSVLAECFRISRCGDFGVSRWQMMGINLLHGRRVVFRLLHLKIIDTVVLLD